jgi:hypothetical protein
MRVGDDEKHQIHQSIISKKLRPIITRKCAAAAASAGRKRDKRDHSPPPDQKNIFIFLPHFLNQNKPTNTESVEMEVRRAMKVTKSLLLLLPGCVLISLLLGLAARLLLDGLALLVVLGVLQLGHNFARVSGRVEVVGVLARLLFAPLLARVSGVDVLFELVVVVLVRVNVVLGHFCCTCFAV